MNNLTNNNLLGKFRTGTHNIDHIIGTYNIINSLILAKLMNRKEIIYLDHKEILIKFNISKILKSRLLTYLGIRNINRVVN